MGLEAVFEQLRAAERQGAAIPAAPVIPDERPPKPLDYSPTGVADQVRHVLRDHFLTAKFRVTTKKYSGGSSIDVRWKDGPSQNDVEKLVGHMHGADFNGMEDLKENNGSPYGNDYIFFARSYSSEAYRTAGLKVAADYGIQVAADITTDALLGTWLPQRLETIGQNATRELSGLTLPERNVQV